MKYWKNSVGEMYGVDAPPVIAGMFAAGVAMAAAGVVVRRKSYRLGVILAAIGTLPAAVGVSMLSYGTTGKLRLREYILDGLDLTGTERILDVGTGRGLMAVGAARRVPHGAVTGVDVWRRGDLSETDRMPRVGTHPPPGLWSISSTAMPGISRFRMLRSTSWSPCCASRT